MGLFNDSSRSDAAKKAASLISKVKVPSLAEARAELLPYVQQGIITPEQLETFLQEDTAYGNIVEDPGLRAGQIGALDRYGDIVDNGGMDAQARADLYNAQQQLQTTNRGAQEAIMADARARGQGGSDLEFVNRLVGGQAAATRSAGAGVQAAADAERRRDAALAAMSDLAGKVRGQDYQKAAAEAEARDTITRFNTQNRQNVAGINVQNNNTAQAGNLAAKQQVANQNVSQANELPKMLRDEQWRKTATQANAQGAIGAAKFGENQTARNDIQNGLQFVGQSAGLFSDERVKKDVEPFDAGKLLDDLAPVKFRYKPEVAGQPGAPKGQQVGVFAQDIEREAPGAVSETSDGVKKVDLGQMGGIILAALGDVHQRLKHVEGARG